MSRCGLLIDLDDTLYDEYAYVQSGFRHVAQLVASEHGIAADSAARFLEARFRTDGRGRLFDALLEGHGIAATPAAVAVLVDAYRGHQPAIALDADVVETLVILRQTYRLAVVTDGLPVMQQRKVDALRVADLVDEVVFCWEHDQPKPSPEGFRIALTRLDVPGAAVIGDHIDHDLPAAVALGLPFIRIRQGRYKALAAPAVDVPIIDVSAFRDVPEALELVARCA